MGDEISRRAALRRCAIGGLVLGAGCQTMESDGGDPTTTSTENRATTTDPTETTRSPTTRPSPTTVAEPPPDATRRITLESVNELSDLADMEARVEVVDPFASPESPPAIRATAENTGSRTVEMRAYHEAVLWPQYSEERDPGLSVQPEEKRLGTLPENCWRAQWTLTVLATHRVLTFDPGEARSTELAVLGDPENDGPCLPTGTYRFVDDFPSVCDLDGACRDWGIEFSLQVAATN